MGDILVVLGVPVSVVVVPVSVVVVPVSVVVVPVSTVPVSVPASAALNVAVKLVIDGVIFWPAA